MPSIRHSRRPGTTIAALALAVSMAACNDLLSVENPAAILEAEIENAGTAPALVLTAVSDFQRMYSDMAFDVAIFTDEAVNGHNFIQYQEMDLRLLTSQNSIINSDLWTPLQRARYSGDNVAKRLRVIYGDSANRSLGVARALMYGGYSYVHLGEIFCEGALDVGPAISSDSLLKIAMMRFDTALAVARGHAELMKVAKKSTAAADSLIYIASVGAARAALNLGMDTVAIRYVTTGNVPRDFTAWIQSSDQKSYQENSMYYATTGNNRYLGVDASFRGLKVDTFPDTRVKHTRTSGTGHNGLTRLFIPFQPPSYREFTFNFADSARFLKTTDIRFSSGLEARYIRAEALLRTGVEDSALVLVNERRRAGIGTRITDAQYAASHQVTLTGAALAAALRDQRRRDFYLDGHRLGDLRRYKRFYQIDFYPTGAHPNTSWGNYGTSECYPIPGTEAVGNPNL